MLFNNHPALGPLQVACPRCGAQPGRECVIFQQQFKATHIERVVAGAQPEKRTLNLVRKERRERLQSYVLSLIPASSSVLIFVRWRTQFRSVPTGRIEKG